MNEVMVIGRFLNSFSRLVCGLFMLKLVIDCRIIVFMLLSSMVNIM